MRFKVHARDVPVEAAARRLGLTCNAFGEMLNDLLARGFPAPDPTTGHYDLNAIEVWMDKRSGLLAGRNATARDAAAVVLDRLNQGAGRE